MENVFMGISIGILFCLGLDAIADHLDAKAKEELQTLHDRQRLDRLEHEVAYIKS